jgi:glycine cleavage system H protein
MPDPTSGLRYLETHEWHRLEDGGVVTIGLTQFAADELTDITYVALPKVGDRVTANQRFGEIESVKATGELYAGVSGAVTAVNAELGAEPGLINHDPYGRGWMIKVKADDPGQLEKLLSPQAYAQRSGH